MGGAAGVPSCDPGVEAARIALKDAGGDPPEASPLAAGALSREQAGQIREWLAKTRGLVGGGTAEPRGCEPVVR